MVLECDAVNVDGLVGAMCEEEALVSSRLS